MWAAEGSQQRRLRRALSKAMEILGKAASATFCDFAGKAKTKSSLNHQRDFMCDVAIRGQHGVGFGCYPLEWHPKLHGPKPKLLKSLQDTVMAMSLSTTVIAVVVRACRGDITCDDPRSDVSECGHAQLISGYLCSKVGFTMARLLMKTTPNRWN